MLFTNFSVYNILYAMNTKKKRRIAIRNVVRKIHICAINNLLYKREIKLQRVIHVYTIIKKKKRPIIDKKVKKK